MEQEMIREECIYLRTRVREIVRKVQSLENSYIDLQTKLKETILIDNKIIGDIAFSSIVQDTKNIENELIYDVSPMIEDKI